MIQACSCMITWIVPPPRCARSMYRLKCAFVRPSTRQGHPGRRLDGNHDLIVVGSHGPQSRSVFGRDDVTMQVLTGADRPVLIIPSDDLSVKQSQESEASSYDFSGF